jgi:hypothetical protein
VEKKVIIAHIIPDEKFICDIAALFDEFCENDYIFAAKNKMNPSFTFIESLRPKILFPEHLHAISCDKYDAIIFHSFYKLEHRLLLDKIVHNKILWFGWGADYYSYNINKLFTTQTLKHYNKIYGYNLFKKIYLSLSINKLYNWFTIARLKNSYKSISKISYFTPILPNEFHLIKNYTNKADHIRYIRWNFPLKVPTGLIEEAYKYDYFIGCSQSIINNHIDILELISRFRPDATILITFSYAGDRHYAEYVYKLIDKLNLKVTLLTEFIEKETYTKILDSAEVGIFNSIRQNAFQNIKQFILRGKKVFLRPENPVFVHLTYLGVKIFTINQLFEKTYLSDLEIKQNIGIIIENYGMEQCRVNTQNLIKEIKASS